MTTGAKIPTATAAEEFLADLLGTGVTARVCTPQQLREGQCSYLASYGPARGEVAALAVTDLQLATAMATAISGMPADETRERVRAEGALVHELPDFHRQVLEVAARLFGGPVQSQFSLVDCRPVPGQVHRSAASLARAPRRRSDWALAIDGHGEGLLTVLA